MKTVKRTDLALELTGEAEKKGVSLEETVINGVEVHTVTVSKHGEKIIGKSAGKYVTLHCGDCSNAQLASAAAKCLKDFLGHIAAWERIMVVGLGNDSITPDSLGSATVKKIPATAHLAHIKEFRELGMRSVIVLETGVLAQTGIESTDQLYYITRYLLPSLIIAIDSLACSEYDRLASTIQLTDTGIALGSGVSNRRKRLTQSTVGVPVIAIGVPTVIDLGNIVPDQDKRGLMVTPQDIDLCIRKYSEIISSAINSVVNPELSPEEINSLLF